MSPSVRSTGPERASTPHPSQSAPRAPSERQTVRGRLAALAVSAGLMALAPAQVGTSFCPGAANSTGAAADLAAAGSIVLSANELQLSVTGLPQGSFGYFLASRVQTSPTTPMGSIGNLCLAGAIGRRVGGLVFNSGATGAFAATADLSAIPQPGGSVAVQPGERWQFQCWYRDALPSGGATSNFSTGVAVLFLGGGGAPVPGLMPIPPGEFAMGSNIPGNLTLAPVHQVTLSQQFWMGRTEVTQAEFLAVMGWNPSLQPGPDRPVETVTWQQARDYCTALTVMHAASLPAGYEYRLPTEAEWEYSCRAYTTSEYHTGSELLCSEARIMYSVSEQANCGHYGSAPVGSHTPNAFGLHDMHGNVWEWCLDTAAPYSAQAVTDPFVNGSATRVIRGGSWGSMSSHCRTANRHGYLPLSTTPHVGFRVVLGPTIAL
jgi:hypothetical protein